MLADIGYWVRTHRGLGASLGVLAIAVAGVALYLTIGRGASFDREVFGQLRVGDEATSLEDDLGEPDYIDQGEAAVAVAWVEEGIEYYVISRREKIVSKGYLSCDQEEASAC